MLHWNSPLGQQSFVRFVDGHLALDIFGPDPAYVTPVTLWSHQVTMELSL